MKNKGNYIVYGFLALFVMTALIFSLFLFWGSKKSNKAGNQGVSQKNNASGQRLTRFDAKLAKKFMDEDRDGQCDVCGMTVKSCIESGQLECNMDKNSKIDILGTQDIHIDWKIYVNGRALDASFFKPRRQKSSFIHVDDAKNPSEQLGDILHIHANGVPLWLFFESIGGKFDNTQLIVSDGKQFSNGSEKKLKFYVNGVPSDSYGNYVPKDSDKILISYGNANEDVRAQLNSITNFAKNY